MGWPGSTSAGVANEGLATADVPAAICWAALPAAAYVMPGRNVYKADAPAMTPAVFRKSLLLRFMEIAPVSQARSGVPAAGGRLHNTNKGNANAKPFSARAEMRNRAANRVRRIFAVCECHYILL
jgi:hypothetical protein